MTLIKSISGMRGTIGGVPGDDLTPIDIIGFTCAYGHLIKGDRDKASVVVGRDGRISGPHVHGLVVHSLIMMGIDVIDLDISTTPTVEMAVVDHSAQGGIIITASHNPKEWNALKFLNDRGEFISQEQGQKILQLAEQNNYEFANVEQLGSHLSSQGDMSRHINAILELGIVDVETIKKEKYHVVVDCINSSGTISVPHLLNALNCTYVLINEEMTGEFAHNPEPLAKNLTDLQAAILEHDADLGIAVDPDVDRLAFIDEKGNYCGEEYTLVMVANWILQNTPGPTVSNLSSTYALREITESHNQQYHAAPVGEVNVVNIMKAKNAIIGGEGNGGIIYPELHYGRDALVGIAILLSALANKKVNLSTYRSQMPDYFMSKDKIALTPEIDIDSLLAKVASEYQDKEIDTQDGVKVYFDGGWVHLRKSNTEPIIRLYSEGATPEKAKELAKIVQDFVSKTI